MARRDDLIEHIRESYALVRAYEEKLALSDDPKEKVRSRRAIQEQQDLIRDWLAELQRLGGGLPADIAELAAPPPEAAPREPSGGTSHYEIHIAHAQGVAIGDGARVEMAGPAASGGGGDVYARYEAGLARLLARLGPQHARRAEALAYEQRLRENLAQARVYGDTETRRAERAEIVGRLNALAQDAAMVTFNELMAG